MPSFMQLPSFNRLTELSHKAINLTQDDALTSKRIESMAVEAAGLKLLFATERVDDAVLADLAKLADEAEALRSMEKMQAGEVMNFIDGFESEHRAVLHTAMRDFFENRNQGKAAREATDLAYKELEKLKVFLHDIEANNRFTDLIQIGIGGSNLGPEAIYVALKAYQKPGRKVHFLSNVDPDDAARILRDVDLSKTLVVVVSKSGSTLETRTNEEFIKDRLKKEGLNPRDHLVAVTGKGSPMDDPEQYLASFYIWDYIGGRYSVTSMIGGVMLAFALGMDRFLDFLRGANAMDKVALKGDIRHNLPLLMALLGIWNRNFLDHETCAVIPYSQALSRFPAHLQQLDMESNGKHVDKAGHFVTFQTGPIIWGEPGTNGQHSFFQSLHQGTTIVPLIMLGFRESQYRDDFNYKGTMCQEKLLSNLFAQSIALAQGQKSANPNKEFSGNRPNRIILADRLDAYTMGTILALFEHMVAFMGFIWNINSFDQEGVQLGKVLALKCIDLFAAKHNGKVDSKAFPLGSAYLKHLN